MREQDDQLNEEMLEDSSPITGVDSDPEDDSILELPDNEVTDDDELQELNLGER